ncbi:hypothetical protein ACFY2R_29700 [Micromonospora olivasterospora]|uniref:Uncharacterized protein n=1 Tax=Micromonospora olivasterospora TaxID=1880 RepID=A0A562IF38_MICOL|nr:hypothetical protein [Micromonospora olivasterospora]TWH69522.1 hypothetical protein JD77_04532 [Micromonospora olivasterospora]
MILTYLRDLLVTVFADCHAFGRLHARLRRVAALDAEASYPTPRF